METKICPKCALQAKSNARFCKKCGTELVQKTMTQAVVDGLNRGMMGGKEESTGKARIIRTPAPLENEMAKIKKMYWVCLAAMGIGLIIDVFLNLGLIGLVVVFIIDVIAVEVKRDRLRAKKFKFISGITNEQLFLEMQPTFNSYGMLVERRDDGTVVLDYNGYIYDILLKPDETFSIWWRVPLSKAFLPKGMYKSYRTILAAMGAIAYEIQVHFGITEAVRTQNLHSCFSETENENHSSVVSLKTQSNMVQINWLAIISGIVMMMSTFLPVIQLNVLGSNMSQNLFNGGDGIFFIAIAIIALIFAFKGKDKGVLVVGSIGCILLVVEISSIAEMINSNEYGTLYEYGMGYYLLILSSIVLLISGFIRKLQNC